MRRLVGKMNQVCSLGTDGGGHLHRLGDAEMGRVWPPKQGVEYEDLYAAQPIEGRVGNGLGIRHVPQVPRPIGEHPHRAMRKGDRFDCGITYLHQIAVANGPSVSFGFGRPGKGTHALVEDVRKALRKAGQHLGFGVHGQRILLPNGDGPYVVDAVNVIGMIVREEHRIYPVYAGLYELQSKFGGGVDEEARAAIGLDHRPHTSAPVSHIGGPAHGARTADYGNPEARPGSQKGQLHTVSTLSRLVVPGTSNGTPAVTITFSPSRASPSRRSAARALAYMPSYVSQCGTRAGTTPHTRANW